MLAQTTINETIKLVNLYGVTAFAGAFLAVTIIAFVWAGRRLRCWKAETAAREERLVNSLDLIDGEKQAALIAFTETMNAANVTIQRALVDQEASFAQLTSKIGELCVRMEYQHDQWRKAE